MHGKQRMAVIVIETPVMLLFNYIILGDWIETSAINGTVLSVGAEAYSLLDEQ